MDPTELYENIIGTDVPNSNSEESSQTESFSTTEPKEVDRELQCDKVANDPDLGPIGPMSNNSNQEVISRSYLVTFAQEFDEELENDEEVAGYLEATGEWSCIPRRTTAIHKSPNEEVSESSNPSVTETEEMDRDIRSDSPLTQTANEEISENLTPPVTEMDQEVQSDQGDDLSCPPTQAADEEVSENSNPPVTEIEEMDQEVQSDREGDLSCAPSQTTTEEVSENSNSPATDTKEMDQDVQSDQSGDLGSLSTPTTTEEVSENLNPPATKTEKVQNNREGSAKGDQEIEADSNVCNNLDSPPAERIANSSEEVIETKLSEEELLAKLNANINDSIKFGESIQRYLKARRRKRRNLVK